MHSGPRAGGACLPPDPRPWVAHARAARAAGVSEPAARPGGTQLLLTWVATSEPNVLLE
jgi:hypothetical protein